MNQRQRQNHEKVIYRSHLHGELPLISAFITSVFDEFIGPGYDPRGREEFLDYIHPAAIAYRLKRKQHFLRVATIEEQIVGMLEMRNYNHVSLLFVDGKFQRQGIGRILLSQGISLCLEKNPNLSNITVHSDPKAATAYFAMGFRTIGDERTENGITYIPMQYTLNN